ncbi:MAG: hypothetical protein ACK56F_19145, partial [bacterium]
GAYTATLYVMVNRVTEGWAVTPHPHQPRLIFPSRGNVLQNSAIATPYVLCGFSYVYSERPLPWQQRFYTRKHTPPPPPPTTDGNPTGVQSYTKISLVTT